MIDFFLRNYFQIVLNNYFIIFLLINLQLLEYHFGKFINTLFLIIFELFLNYLLIFILGLVQKNHLHHLYFHKMIHSIFHLLYQLQILEHKYFIFQQNNFKKFYIKHYKIFKFLILCKFIILILFQFNF